MAVVVNLEGREHPLSDCDWVMVEPLPSGQCGSEGLMSFHGAGATFYAGPARDWATVIADAVTWADRNRIQVVYVRGRS
jgi:hypothetical protein